ncbi:MAG: BatA domain-containing protein [Candidatus Omnitrophica bacterium]|nr:BatA domain-containing protein [Candidatus Omnitrophota bacterium]
MSLFGVAFTNPFLWFGLLAAGIPFLIHLLTKRTPVNIYFPTIRFLKSAKANQSSLHRIRHLLLLALRTLIVLLVLAAFLKPVFQTGALVAGEDRNRRTASILILDTSLSMGHSLSGVSPLSRAKVAANKLLDDLGGEDLANVILAAAQPTVALEEPKSNQYQLKREIEKTNPTLEFADIDAAIGIALGQLENLDSYAKEIHFISDFQRTNWASVNFGVIPESVKTVFLSVADERTTNTAIVETLLDPSAPAVSEKTTLTCKVANYSDSPRTVPVHLEINGEKIESKEVTLKPGMTESVSFQLRPRTSGIHEGSVSLPDDGLLKDNRRWFILPVMERLEVTVLSDSNPLDRPLSDRALIAALNPFEGERGSLDPRFLKPDQFDRFVAARTQGVIVSNVDRFSRETAQALFEYLRNGGGLIYFLSGETDKFNLALLAEVSEGNFDIPYRPVNYLQPKTGAKSAFTALQEANYDHPMLKKFRETGALAEIRFYRYFETDRAETKGQILLRYDDGNIALAEKSVGIGTLLLANFSPDLNSCDLARRTVFIPLVHEMFRNIRPKMGGSRNFTAGNPCSTTVRFPSEAAQARFTSPDGEEINAGLEMNGQEGAVLIGETPQVGFYRIYSAEKKVGVIPVNVDPRESNLDSLSPEQLRELTQISRDRFFAESGRDLENLRRLREGLPLWYYFLLGGLACIAIEQIFSLVWRR